MRPYLKWCLWWECGDYVGQDVRVDQRATLGVSSLLAEILSFVPARLSTPGHVTCNFFYDRFTYSSRISHDILSHSFPSPNSSQILSRYPTHPVSCYFILKQTWSLVG